MSTDHTSLITYGVNHKTAPINIRERIAFGPERVSHVLQEWQQYHAVNEAVLLSTCNRTEIYTITEHAPIIQDWLHQKQGIDMGQFGYCLQGIDAIRHAFRVASGLDSMIPGEPEILGQIKHAYQLALTAGIVGKQMQHLFPYIFAVSKQVRTETTIGSNAVTLAYAAVALAKHIFSQISHCRVLLVGAGHVMELMATHLIGQQVRQLMIANRTLKHAQQLAHQFGGQAVRFSEIPACLDQSDIVITATASQLPIIGKGLIESILKSGKRRPLFMVDLAVPRNIEPQVAELEDVYLYNVDDLEIVISENLKNRQQAAKQAEALIEIQTLNYLRQLRILNASNLIRDYRRRLEVLKEKELSHALEQLQKGHNPQTVLHNFAHALINKILHHPTIKLRQAAHEDQKELLMLAKDLFNL